MRWLWIVERVIILRYRMPLPSRVGRMEGCRRQRKGHGRSRTVMGSHSDCFASCFLIEEGVKCKEVQRLVAEIHVGFSMYALWCLLSRQNALRTWWQEK